MSVTLFALNTIFVCFKILLFFHTNTAVHNGWCMQMIKSLHHHPPADTDLLLQCCLNHFYYLVGWCETHCSWQQEQEIKKRSFWFHFEIDYKCWLIFEKGFVNDFFLYTVYVISPTYKWSQILWNKSKTFTFFILHFLLQVVFLTVYDLSNIN